MWSVDGKSGGDRSTERIRNSDQTRPDQPNGENKAS